MSDYPIQTLKPPQPKSGGGTLIQRNNTALGRSRTLTRMDRAVEQPPLVVPAASSDSGHSRPWKWYSRIITFWAPAPLLKACGIVEKPKQQAWREKIALCSISLIISAVVGFICMGVDRVLCPSSQGTMDSSFERVGMRSG